jgi:hypothetical protein
MMLIPARTPPHHCLRLTVVFFVTFVAKPS